MPQPMLALALCVAAGALTGDELPASALARLLLLAGTALLLALGAGPSRAAAALGGAAFAIGAAGAGVSRLEYERTPLRAWVRGEPVMVRLSGRASEDAVRRDGQLLFEIDVRALRAFGREMPTRGRARVRVGGEAPHPRVREADEIAVWVELQAPRGFGNPGSPDFAADARRRGTHASGY